jgi:hypothetical protein
MDGLIPLATLAAFLCAGAPDLIRQQAWRGAAMLLATVWYWRRGLRALRP